MPCIPVLQKILSLSVTAALIGAGPTSAFAENLRGTSSGPTSLTGHSQREQVMTFPEVKPAPNFYPRLQWPEQEGTLQTRLADREAATGRKPNIVVFLMDDVAFSDPGFNGGGNVYGQPTPNFDRYAAQGTVLTSAYSTPTCTPSRASLLTGQSPLHHGLLRPSIPGEQGGLNDPMTLPMVLKTVGYTTQGMGKWHLGESRSALPQNLGFDDFYGFSGVPEYFTGWRDPSINPELALSPERYQAFAERESAQRGIHCRASDTEACERTEVIDIDQVKTLDEDYASRAEDFIRTGAEGDTPWFLMQNTRGCHFFNYPSDKWAGRSPARTVYSDCIVEMDDIFGRLMKAVEDSGQADNTIVVVTSDNGPECEVPPAGHTAFRGCKGTAWEGGVRVPTFVYWPGMVPTRRSDALFDQMDLFNTLAHVAGVDQARLSELVPTDRYISGIDQASFLLVANGRPNRRSRIYTMNKYVTGVRVDEFKWVITGQDEEGISTRGYVGGFSGSIWTDSGGITLYNLYRSPREEETLGNRLDNVFTFLQPSLVGFFKDLETYPTPPDALGFYDNNPPMYQLLPELLQRFQERSDTEPTGGGSPAGDAMAPIEALPSTPQ